MSIQTNQSYIKRSISRIETGGRCSGKAVVTVTGSSAQDLRSVMPEFAKSALITVEADATSSPQNLVIRFWESGDAPTTTDGIPLGHLDTYEIVNIQNLANFKVIATDGTKSHKLQILFYR